MRKEKDLNVPNGSTHAKRAAIRTVGGKDWMQEVEQMPETQETVGLGDILRGEVELTTRTQGGSPAVVKVPHSILAVLVTIFLGVAGAAFWLVSSISEMKANLTHIQQNQREARAIYSGNLRLMTAYATNETNRVQFMVGLLSPAARKEVFEFDKANPRPPLPNVDEIEEKEQ